MNYIFTKILSHKRTFFALVLVSSLFLYACSKDCLKQSGIIVKKEIKLGEFNSIIVYDNLNVIIKQDTINRAILEAGKNLIDNIEFDIEDNTLKIRNKNSCRWVKGFQDNVNLFLHIQNLKELTYEGYGNICSQDSLSLDNFILSSWGGGGSIDLNLNTNYCWVYSWGGCTDITLRGRANICYITQKEASKIEAYNFLVKQLFVNQEGLNNCYLNSQKELNFKISNKGNIYCKGNFKVLNGEQIGSGELIRVNN